MRYLITIISSIALLTALLYWQHNVSPAKEKAAATGPILYGINGSGKLFKIDVMNCTACPIANLNLNGGASDVLVLPNGDILVHSDGLQRFTLPNSSPIWTGAVGEGYDGSILAPNGTIYLSRISPSAGLSIFDPLTNNITFIGNWPTGMVITEFFYQNGVLYGFGGLSGAQVVVQINTTTPSLSTVLNSTPPLGGGGTTSGGYTTAFGGGGSGLLLYQYNVATNSFTFVCDLAPFSTFSITGLSDLPSGVPIAPCLCTTFAGTVNDQTFNICVPGTVTVPYNTNAVLGNGDILRYILFSNTNDTLGSIIVQNSSPLIAFNPATMQTGVPYYLATIAGDNLNGNVDLSDPCLDISDVAAQVIWRPRPTVSFSTGNTNLCAGDCRTVTATFTGTPPFTLTYTVAGSGSQTQVFSGNTGTFQVCVPAGTPNGSLQVVATGLVDTWCGCSP
jgi:hypothetical protein